MTSSPLFAIGDIQGCDAALEQLLDRLPANAHILCLGDLVNRGPDSLAVLRRLKAMGNRAKIILGNHDIHLMARVHHIRKAGSRDTLEPILHAPDCWELIDWLRHQPLVRFEEGILCVHAGVLPQWTLEQTLALAKEVEQQLQSDHYVDFLANAFGNQPNTWDPNLSDNHRLRFIINTFTRLRLCTAEGTIDFTSKDGLHPPSPSYLPWFEHSDRQTQNTPIAFGHWSTLGLINRPHLIGLDTGCVWGGPLSAMRLTPTLEQRLLIQVSNKAQSPQ